MSHKYIRFIYLIFFLTGISGLIYQTVWLRVLSRVLGSTTEAASITISSFMLGLSLGSYFIGRYSKKYLNHFRLYAWLELGIAVSAVGVFFLFERLVPLYVTIFEATGEDIFLFRFFQATILFVLLLIPTFLMGGTLPLLSSAMLSHEKTFTRMMGYLYGLNTLGAMAGVLLSGFITIGIIGELNTMLTGVFFNLVAGVAVLAFVRKPKMAPVEVKTKVNNETSKFKKAIAPTLPEAARNFIVIAYAIVGFCSLALEVVWIRIFQLPLGTAIYAFSAVLTVYLGGSALGSYVFGKYFTRLSSLLETAGLTIILIGLWGLAGIYLFEFAIPWQQDPSQLFEISDVYVPLLVIFPITFMLGFIFPVVTRIYVSSEQETASKVGKLYSLNTFGCILGALAAGYLFIPHAGTYKTIIIVSLINIAVGFRLIFYETKMFKPVLRIAFLTATVIAAMFMIFPSSDPYYKVVNNFIRKGFRLGFQIKYHKETPTATVTALTSTVDPMERHLLVNGVGVTRLCVETKLMAHLPILLHRNPKDMLIICYGMGTSLRSAVAYKDLKIDQVELVSELYEINDIYHANGKEILANPRVSAYVDDGRNFLLMRTKKYDVISIDPAPPIWSAGTVNLYTTEFIQLCRDHLNENGIFCLWIPPSAFTEVKMIMKSFLSVFPQTEVYRGPYFAGFYMMGYLNYYAPEPQRFIAAARNSAVTS
ncbi:fused MFS/spermidine synthase, partial [bacterium AH-315-M05]|nr:fused MFS/spermidine synthase [bacterium AH-315-M05]